MTCFHGRKSCRTLSENRKSNEAEPRKRLLAYRVLGMERLLIVRGAVFESIVPEAKDMTDEEAAVLLRLALTSQPAQEFLRKRAEGATS